ncbi:MAG: hypothetical protein R3F37_15750 [Candidatus Competibacteraceae bacterium]
MKATSSSVLEIDAVSLSPKDVHHMPLQDIALLLATGECALISMAQIRSCSLIGDLAQGLLEPDVGQVRFRGHSWADLDRATQAVQRGLTGRVFAGTAWISNLDVDENILLAGQHHQALPEGELRQTATALARRFGLAGLPQRRPSQLSAHELKLAQWVRALLGRRQLLVWKTRLRVLIHPPFPPCWRRSPKPAGEEPPYYGSAMPGPIPNGGSSIPISWFRFTNRWPLRKIPSVTLT